MDQSHARRPLGELFGDLSRQLSVLVRQEIQLARTEVSQRAGTVGRDAAMVGAGGALLYAGFLGLMAAIALLLVEAGLQPWLAAFLVGTLVVLAGGALVARGRSGLASADLTPRRTLETLRDDAEWAKERMP